MNTYYFLRGYNEEFQEYFWVGPFINMDSNIPNEYSGSIIRSNEYSSYFDPKEILSFDLFYFKTNRTQLQLWLFGRRICSGGMYDEDPDFHCEQ